MDYDSVDIYDYDSDDIYDDSNANTGTDIFTLDYRHVEINNNDNKVYNLYDNFFNHIDEINIMDTILSFVANDDIKGLINFRCVDTYSRDCTDNFLKNELKRTLRSGAPDTTVLCATPERYPCRRCTAGINTINL